MSEHRIGVVTHFFPRKQVATVRLEEPIHLGDRVHVQGRKDDFEARVKSMQIDHKPIEVASPGDEVGIQLPRRAREGDVVLRVEGEVPWWRRLLGL